MHHDAKIPDVKVPHPRRPFRLHSFRPAFQTSGSCVKALQFFNNGTPNS
jgi:hypothetical protein